VVVIGEEVRGGRFCCGGVRSVAYLITALGRFEADGLAFDGITIPCFDAQLLSNCVLRLKTIHNHAHTGNPFSIIGVLFAPSIMNQVAIWYMFFSSQHQTFVCSMPCNDRNSLP
jgi:hypothetical protein